MLCPTCGARVTDPEATACARCGTPFPWRAAGATPPPSGGGQEPATWYPSPPPAQAAGAWPPGPPVGETDIPPAPSTSPYGPPPGYPPYGYPAPPGYAAPPSYPLAPGYAAPPTTPPYPPGYLPPAPRKSRVGLIVGIVLAAVVVLCGAGVGTLYVIGSSLPLVSGGTVAPPGTAGTPTAASTATPAATPSGTLLYQSALRGPPSGMANDQNCVPSATGYRVTSDYVCYVPVGDQSSLDVTVTVQQISGSTTYAYGITLRRAQDDSGEYDFGVDSNGKWVFLSCAAQNCTRVVDFTPNSAIRGGLNTANTIEVRAQGSNFTFFVNGVQVGHAVDTTYTTGILGLANLTDGECVFTDVTVLRPPT